MRNLWPFLGGLSDLRRHLLLLSQEVFVGPPLLPLAATGHQAPLPLHAHVWEQDTKVMVMAVTFDLWCVCVCVCACLSLSRGELSTRALAILY